MGLGTCSIYALISGAMGTANITVLSLAPSIDPSITYAGPAGELTVRHAQVQVCTAPNTPMGSAMVMGVASSPSKGGFLAGHRIQVLALMRNSAGSAEIDIHDLSTGKITVLLPWRAAIIRITSP